MSREGVGNRLCSMHQTENDPTPRIITSPNSVPGDNEHTFLTISPDYMSSYSAFGDPKIMIIISYRSLKQKCGTTNRVPCIEAHSNDRVSAWKRRPTQRQNMYSTRMVSSSKKSKSGTHRQTQTALLHLSKFLRKKHKLAEPRFHRTGTFYFRATCVACQTSASVTKTRQ